MLRRLGMLWFYRVAQRSGQIGLIKSCSDQRHCPGV